MFRNFLPRADGERIREGGRGRRVRPSAGSCTRHECPELGTGSSQQRRKEQRDTKKKTKHGGDGQQICEDAKGGKKTRSNTPERKEETLRTARGMNIAGSPKGRRELNGVERSKKIAMGNGWLSEAKWDEESIESSGGKSS